MYMDVITALLERLRACQNLLFPPPAVSSKTFYIPLNYNMFLDCEGQRQILKIALVCFLLPFFAEPKRKRSGN